MTVPAQMISRLPSPQQARRRRASMEAPISEIIQSVVGSGTALVATIVNMAHALNVSVLGEGVETEEQVALLQAAGCKLMQGYYFGKPVWLERAQDKAA